MKFYFVNSNPLTLSFCFSDAELKKMSEGIPIVINKSETALPAVIIIGCAKNETEMKAQLVELMKSIKTEETNL